MTRTAAHKVKSGESLWSIARHHYGAGHVWPSIYIYNNSPAVRRLRGNRGIVNPNLIHPGEIVYLPPISGALLNDPAVRKQVTQQAGPAHAAPSHAASPLPAGGTAKAATGISHSGRPGPTALLPQGQRPAGPTAAASSHAPAAAPGRLTGPAQAPAAAPHSNVDNPAEHLIVKGYAHAYRLDDIPIATQRYNGFTATIKLQGVLAIQADDKTALVTYSNKDLQFQARREADGAFGQLLSDQKVTWDRTKKTISFECVMTSRANAHAVGTAISAGVNSDGKPVIRSTVVFPKFGGYIGRFTYGTAEFKVVLELSVDPETRNPPPSPAPVTVPVPAPSRFQLPEVHVSHEAQQVVTAVAVVAVAAVVVWFAWPVIVAYGAGAAATAGVAATAAGMTVWEGERQHIRSGAPPQS